MSGGTARRHPQPVAGEPQQGDAAQRPPACAAPSPLRPRRMHPVCSRSRAHHARAAKDDGSGYADERLRTLAGKMSTPARELAYRVAYAMGLADMEASDEEFELDLQLVDALELSNDRAEELVDEVMAIMDG